MGLHCDQCQPGFNLPTCTDCEPGKVTSRKLFTTNTTITTISVDF